MSTVLSNPTITTQLSSDLVSGLLSGNVTHRHALTPSIGTPAGSVNLMYTSSFTLASGTPLSIDLTSIIDVGNNSVSFGHLTHLLLENISLVSGENIAIGGGTNGVFTLDPTTAKPNGGAKLLIDPNPGIVIDGTHKIITLAAASGTGVLGRITILGRSV